MKNLDLISDLIKGLQKQIDDIEWGDHTDPRIEGLVQQLNHYKDKQEKDEMDRRKAIGIRNFEEMLLKVLKYNEVGKRESHWSTEL